MDIRYIRPSDDRLEISGIYESSWKSAYKGIIPQAYLDSIPKGRWVANLDNPSWHTLLCVEDGRPVGTSSFCASRFDDYPGWGEMISIYLLPEYIGKGYGRRLFSEAVDALRGLGYTELFLWVLEENLRARRFYERAGFSPTEDYLDDCIGGKPLRELRYIYSVRDEISLRKMTGDDLPLLRRWLAAPHVARWYRDPEDWIAEAEGQDGEFSWIHHFIAERDGTPIGFCQYYAGRDSGEDWLAHVQAEGCYSLDYLIGEPDMLRRGFGKRIVALLTEKILRHEDARRVAVQPERENAASRALLRSCGFKLTDSERGIYVKELR